MVVLWKFIVEADYIASPRILVSQLYNRSTAMVARPHMQTTAAPGSVTQHNSVKQSSVLPLSCQTSVRHVWAAEMLRGSGQTELTGCFNKSVVE